MSFGVSGACSAGLQPTRPADRGRVFSHFTETQRQRPSGDSKFPHSGHHFYMHTKEGAPHYKETQGDKRL